MEKENVNTVKYSASVDSKFGKIALALGVSKRMLFEKMEALINALKPKYNRQLYKIILKARMDWMGLSWTIPHTLLMIQ
jgi:hypothetical protein